jgi:Domain of unknown function (DUF1824)
MLPLPLLLLLLQWTSRWQPSHAVVARSFFQRPLFRQRPQQRPLNLLQSESPRLIQEEDDAATDLDRASKILTEWDRYYSISASLNETLDDPSSWDNLRSCVLLLNQEAEQQRREFKGAHGRCMLGICADSAPLAVATLKSWVNALALPRGLLHGMDVNGVPITTWNESGYYIKYNTGGAYTFEQIKKSGLGFESLWKPGDAYLEPYPQGQVRGVYFQVELQDNVFRQYLLPLTLFD